MSAADVSARSARVAGLVVFFSVLAVQLAFVAAVGTDIPFHDQ